MLEFTHGAAGRSLLNETASSLLNESVRELEPSVERDASVLV